MFGLPSSLPIFIAPAALARLGHPDGEMNLTRAAGAEGILQGVRPPFSPSCSHSHCLQVSSNSSCSVDEIMSAAQPDQNLIFQVRAHAETGEARADEEDPRGSCT